jgi:nicotinamidase-related amidase
MAFRTKPALILIDIQKAFLKIENWGGGRNNPKAEANMEKLLKYWRKKKLPLFHVKHCSTTPTSMLAEGNDGNAFMDFAQPKTGEPVIKKNVNSAFIGTDLKEQLEKTGIETLVIIGLTTDHCVSTTTRMAGNFGFETYLIADATATFDKTTYDGKKYKADIIHKTALASLNEEFATVLTTKSILDLLK